MTNVNDARKTGRLNPVVRVLLYLVVATLWGVLGGYIMAALQQAVWEMGLPSEANTLLFGLISVADTVVLLVLMRLFVFFSKADMKLTVRPLAIALLLRSIASWLGSLLVSALSGEYYREINRFARELGELGVVFAHVALPVILWWVIGRHFRKGMPAYQKSLYINVAIIALIEGCMSSVMSYQYMRVRYTSQYMDVLFALPGFLGMLLAQWKGVYAFSMDSARGYKPDAAGAAAPADTAAPASRVKTQEVGRIRGDGLETLNRDDARDTLTGSDGLENLDRDDELDKHWGRKGKKRIRSRHDDGLSRFDSLENEERVIAASSREAIRVMEHNELQMKHDDRICDDDHK